MSNISKSVRQLQESRAEDFRVLSQLTRDLEAELAGPKKVKVKIGPKYVEGVTKSQGDAQYESELRNTNAMMMGRAFGPNMDLGDVAQDILGDLESHFGSDREVADYIALATQVFCHLCYQATKRASSTGQAGADLAAAKPVFMDAMTDPAKGLLNAIGELDLLMVTPKSGGPASKSLFFENTIGWLYPLSYSHIKAVTAEAKQVVNLRSEYIDYIKQYHVQNAVLTYMIKPGNTPPNNVLLPAAINGFTNVAVDKAFSQYGDKDVKATFDYYFKATKSEIDMSTGIRIGDAESQIKAAITALGQAANSLNTTGLSSKVISQFKSGFTSIANKLKKVNPLSNTADEDIGFLTLELLDMLGGLSGMATSSVSLNGISGFDTSTGSLIDYVLTRIANQIPSQYDNEEIAFLDAQDEIRPSDITTQNRRNVLFAAVQNNLGLALMNLEDAFNSVVPLGAVVSKRGISQKAVAVTKDFKDLVEKQIARNVAALKGMLRGRAASKLDAIVIYNSYVEALNLVLGVSTVNKGTVLDGNNLLSLASTSMTLDISESMFNRIADGRIVSLKSVGADGRTLEQQLIDFVDAQFRNQTGRTSSNVRTATRDAVIRSADLLIATLNGLRVQAENIGMQTRQNPMGGGLLAADTHAKKAGVGAMALYSDHASAALINRFAKPTAGSIGSYASDYGVSLATALWGASFVSGMEVPVLNANGEKNEGLGYSMIAGAGLHALLRTLYKHNIGNLRFSDSAIAKIGQALVTAPAHLLGDSSMGYSALNPADAHGHEANLIEWLSNLIRVSPKSTVCHLGIQLWMHGLNGLGVRDESYDISFTVGTAPTIAEDGKLTADQLESLGKLLNAMGALCYAVCDGLELNVKSDDAGRATISGKLLDANNKAKDTAIKAAGKACKAEAEKCLGLSAGSLGLYVQKVGGFIQEPGYNLDVYSGEDHVNYVQPAPIQTAQSGIAQLDAAIARAARLDHHELSQEGLSDMVEVEIIRATPKTARMAEQAGVGVSLGKSRMNPHTEVVALEVMGANTLMDIVPARQYSVPQGALNYPRIEPAQNIQVASNGLFNRGAFTPVFSG